MLHCGNSNAITQIWIFLELSILLILVISYLLSRQKKLLQKFARPSGTKHVGQLKISCSGSVVSLLLMLPLGYQKDFYD
jgi:hypothetical protein